MRKLLYGYTKAIGTDKLCGNCAAIERLCVCYILIDSTIALHFKPLAIFCDCTARFVLDLVGKFLVMQIRLVWA